MLDTYQALFAAIKNRQAVSALYQGLVRELCPHVLGHKNGRLQCLCFQFGGASRTGLPPGGLWRCVPLEELQVLDVYDAPWRTGSEQTRPLTCIDEAHIEVSPRGPAN